MMRNRFVILFVFATACFYSSAQPDSWIQLDDVNGAPKSACVGFELGGEGYVGLGLDQYFERRQLYSYDVGADDWDDQEDIGNSSGLGLSRSSAVSFSIGNLAYMGLGSSTGDPYFIDFWQYDPATDSWSQMANFDGAARRQAVGFSINDLGYVGTGVDENGNYRKDFWEYDPNTNAWTQLNDFGGAARQSAVGFSMGDFGYIATGDTGVPSNDFWEYDPALDQWTQKPDFPGTKRAGAVGFGVYPQAIIATGYDIDLNYTNDVWEFNIDSNIWRQRGDFLGSARTKAVAFVIGDYGYLGTGYNDDYLEDFWGYTMSHICITDTSSAMTDACPSGYTWNDGDGNTYLPADGTGPWYHTLPAQSFVGCDSVMTLYLNWIVPDTSVAMTDACPSGYTWIDGNTYLPADGTGPWYHTMPGQSFAGCDSVASLYLNWIVPDTSVTLNQACSAVGYTWIDGNTYMPVDGTGPWFHTMPGASSAGCDSTASLTINWNDATSSVVNDVACENDGYPWIDGNTYQAADGTGPWFHTLSGGSAAGCDSVVELNLTWESVDNITVDNDGTTLTSNSAASNTFQWVDCDNGYAVIPGETGQSYTPTVTGNYAVIVTDGACQDTSDCEEYINYLAIDENDIFGQISIYPNPTHNIVNINFGDLKDVSVKVYTVAGRLVFVSDKIHTTSYQFNLDQAAGIYSLEIESAGLRKWFKLVKD